MIVGNVVGDTIVRRVYRIMVASSAEALHEEGPAPAVTAAPGDSSEAERRNYDGMMRAQAEALNQITKQVIVSEPRPRDGLLSAVSRLEARLAVTEQSLTALDQRLSERLKGLDGDTTALAERLHGLRQRLEKFEEKQLVALAQIRLDVHNLRHAPQTDVEPQQEQPEQPEQEVPLPAPVFEEQTGETMPEEAAGEETRAITYLDTARKAAIEAAERSAAMPAKHKPGWKTLWRKKTWVAVAVATILVTWFDAYVFAHYQPAQGAIAERSVEPFAVRPSPRAEFIRGLKYWNGSGVVLDAVRGKALIERAALRGDAVAEEMMGGIAQNDTAAGTVRAIGWYESAAQHGNRKAMAELGKLYAGGWKEGTDFAKAADWFAKAALAGDVDAAFDLAILYDRGLGRPHDIAEAYRWYAVAAGSGDKHAASRATVLAGKIAPNERDGLDRAILAFKPAPLDRNANDQPVVKS